MLVRSEGVEMGLRVVERMVNRTAVLIPSEDDRTDRREELERMVNQPPIFTQYHTADSLQDLLAGHWTEFRNLGICYY